jgi:hypothetical protein
MPTNINQGNGPVDPQTTDWDEFDRAQQAELTRRTKRSATAGSPSAGRPAARHAELKELPEKIKPILRSWLAQGRTIKEFFEATREQLGDMAGYNLVEFLSAQEAIDLSTEAAAQIARLREPHVPTLQKPLPDQIKPILERWLAGGRSMAEFFEIFQAQLGHPNQYDLADFHEQKQRLLPETAKPAMRTWLATGRPLEQFFQVNHELAPMNRWDLAEFGITIQSPENPTKKKQLPYGFRVMLVRWLAAGKTLESFFSANAAQLGSQDQYDLSTFQPDSTKGD